MVFQIITKWLSVADTTGESVKKRMFKSVQLVFTIRSVHSKRVFVDILAPGRVKFDLGKNSIVRSQQGHFGQVIMNITLLLKYCHRDIVIAETTRKTHVEDSAR